MNEKFTLSKNNLNVHPLIKRLKYNYDLGILLLKRLALLLCLVFFFSAAQAQKNTDFYYYGGTKVYLSHSAEKISVRMKSGGEETMKETLQRDFQLPESAFTTLRADKSVVITLRDLDKNKQLRVTSDLSKNSNVAITRPLLISPSGKEMVVEEGFYVKLKQGTSYQQLEDFALETNCILNETPYKYDSRVYFIKAGSINKFDGLMLANMFYESGLFEYSEPDFQILNVLNTPPPNDVLFDMQWAAENTGAANQWNGVVGADIDLLDAWDVTMGSSQIKIAVLDEGIDRSHPDLINNLMPIGLGFEASNANTGDVLGNTSNYDHGTSCAGIIAAEANNSIGMAGVAPNCKLIAVNITGGDAVEWTTNAQCAEAIDWSWDDAGADVLSNSWGGGAQSSIIEEAINRAVTLGRGGKGSVVVFASGNDNSVVSFPAYFPQTIAVGAMSMCHERKSFTSCDGETWWGGNYGTGLDISAPGTKIATTTITGTGTAPNVDYTLTFNGTSAATPFVAGVAALILSVDEELTQSEVRFIIESTASKVGYYSYNSVAEQVNGTWSSDLGHGMVNANNAVLAAQNQGCENTFLYPISVVAVNSELTTIDGCNFYGDYSEISGIVGGYNYEFAIEENGYITVSSGASDGFVLGSGPSPLTIQALTSDNLFVHWSADDQCGTGNDCLTTTVQLVWDCPELEANLGGPCDDGDPSTFNDKLIDDCECQGKLPPDCINTTLYPAGTTIASSTLTQISNCNYFGEYSVVSGIVTDNSYEFTITGGGYITVRTSTYDGPVVNTGNSPLTVLALNADDLFVHWYANDDCGTASSCEITTVQCLTCDLDCPLLFADIGDGCNDGDPNTVNDIVNANCECRGIPVNDECNEAISLVCGEQFNQIMLGATQSLSPIQCEGFITNQALDVWFSFTADGTSSYTLSEFGISDLVLEVFAANNCNDFTSIACADIVEVIELDVLEAGDYLVRAYKYFSTLGAFDVAIQLDCESPSTADFTSVVDWNTSCTDRDATVRFYSQNTGALEGTYTTTLYADGGLSIPAVLVGTYDVILNVPGYLNAGIVGVTISTDGNVYDFGTIIAGDMNDDNLINVVDFSLIVAEFGTTSGSPGFNYLADLNCDGTVNVVDFSLIVTSFGLAGDSVNF